MIDILDEHFREAESRFGAYIKSVCVATFFGTPAPDPHDYFANPLSCEDPNCPRCHGKPLTSSPPTEPR